MRNRKTMLDQLLTLPQFLIPQHFLSRLMLKLTRWQGGRFTQWAIRAFVKHYNIDLSIAHSANFQDYLSFNQFFTRALKPEARPLAQALLISPVDGEISQIGQITEGQLFQAKGHTFEVLDLMDGNAEMATFFKNGLFCTLYLSPRDYHRIHLPITAQLTDMLYVPGSLFSVNQRTTRVVSKLFTRNERVICVFDTEIGKVALVLVGALFVGSITTVWAGEITAHHFSHSQQWNYQAADIPELPQGAEMGRFNMGSTVILLVENQKAAWLPHCTVGKKILMGEALGSDEL